MITEFSGRYRFLSNFVSGPVVFEGHTYPTVEHAYQAAKTVSEDERDLIRSIKSPGAAKRLPKTVRPDWDEIKLSVMEDLLMQKFSAEPYRSQLLDTGEQILIEGNRWHDIFWGRCNCRICEGRGQNQLGKLLMKIRSKLSDT